MTPPFQSASPVAAFTRLAAHPRRMAIGLAAMLVMSGAYTLVCVFLALLHGLPWVPWLRIPDETYYYWTSFVYAPTLLVGWVLAAALLQIFGRLLGGAGSFEATLAVSGVATAVATLGTLVPDLVVTSVQMAGWMDYGAWLASVRGGGVWAWITWAYLVLYLVLFCVLYPAAVIAVHRLPPIRAALAGLAAFAVYQAFLFLVIR